MLAIEGYFILLHFVSIFPTFSMPPYFFAHPFPIKIYFHKINSCRIIKQFRFYFFSLVFQSVINSLVTSSKEASPFIYFGKYLSSHG